MSTENVSGTPSGKFPADGFRIILVSVAFFLAARFSLFFASPHDGVASFRPCGGIFLAALLLNRREMWPALIISLLLGNVGAEISSGVSLQTSLIYTATSCLDAVTCACLLMRFAGTPIRFVTLRETVLFVIFTAVSGNLFAILISLIISRTPFGKAWIWWGVPECVGILLVTPVLLTCFSERFQVFRKMDRFRIAELSVLFLTMILTAQAVFGGGPYSRAFSFYLAHLIFFFLIWAAVRFGPCGSAVASLTVGIIAIWNTFRGYGPVIAASGATPEDIIGIQIYIAVISVTSLLLASLVAERGQAEEARLLSEQRFLLFMRHFPGYAFMKDSQRRIIYMNEKIRKDYGEKAREYLGRTCDDIFPAKLAENIRKDDELVLYKGETVERFEEIEILAHLFPQVRPRVHLVCKFPIPVGNESVSLGGLSVDVTELHQAEEITRENRMRLELAISVGNIGLWDWNIRTGVIFFSPEWKRQIGYEPHEIQDHPAEWESRLHPDDAAQMQAAVNSFMEDPYRNYEHEFRFRHRNGSYRWILAKASIIRDDTGKPCRMLGVHLDITERKRTEEALRASEARFRAMFDSAPIGIFLVNPDNSLVYANNANRLLTGLDLSQITAGEADWMVCIHPDDRENIRAEWQTVMDARACYSSGWRLLNQNGRLIRVDVRGTPVWDNAVLSGYLVMVQDTTVQKETIRALKDSEARYHNAERVGHVGSWEYDILSNRFWGSDGARRIYGFDPASDTFTPDEVENCIPDRIRVHQALVDLIEQGKNYDIDFEIRPKDQDESRYIHSVAELFRDEHGNPVKVIGAIQDITSSKKYEKSLMASEELFRHAFENANEGVCLVDTNGKLTRVNHRMCEIFGYEKRELEAMTVNDIAHPDDKSVSPDFIKKSLAGKAESHVFEKRYLHKNGNIIWGQVSSSLVKGTNGSPSFFISHIRDLTGWKKAEQDRDKFESQLRQAQKLEAVGTLAGGIAHDFNNILAIILGFTEMALEDTEENTELFHHLKQVMAAGERARDLVKQILTFSRRASDHKFSLVKMGLIVNEVIKMLQATLPATLEIRSRIESESFVVGEPTQIHQILMNLATNAGHAMQENGGILEIRLQDTKIETSEAGKYWDLEPGPYVLLVVSDTGSGISPEIMEQIFDPFFTTKGKDEGTGLGLSVVHGIVKSHGGAIHVYSEPGKGSTFKVFLPVAETGEQKENLLNNPLPTGGETILLVDDESSLAISGKLILESLGYKVKAVMDAIEAFEIFSENPGHFDLVITDMTMPRMTGKELALRVMEIRPDIPVILCTGFSSQIDEQKAADAGIRALISKPFLKSQLAGKIRDILDNKKEL